MVKNALEPFWEARVEGVSYGFRPGRGCHNAIQQLFSLGRPNTKRPWVLDADIEGAFDDIGYAALLQALGNFPARGLIKQWLKAGYVEDAMWHPTDTGVPQGGVISPLLLNVALHGMEHALGSSYTPRGTLRGTYALVSYADDLAVLCPTKQAAIDAHHLLATWLGARGLRWSDAKTHMRHLTEGFDYLGLNIRHYPAPQSSRSGYKLLIKPSQGSIQQLRRKLKALWRQQVGSPTVALIHAMNPLIRSWSQYFRIGVASRVFADLDTFMYARAQRYMQRRHPRKSGWWRTQKYWGQTRGPRRDHWAFQDHERHATLRKFAWTRIVRHRLVPKTYSPMTRPSRTTGDSGGAGPKPWRIALGNSPAGSRVAASSVTNGSKTARTCTSIMSFPSTVVARTTSRICDSCMRTAIVRFGVSANLLHGFGRFNLQNRSHTSIRSSRGTENTCHGLPVARTIRPLQAGPSRCWRV
jgi:RNA-directed DNA polymerase